MEVVTQERLQEIENRLEQILERVFDLSKKAQMADNLVRDFHNPEVTDEEIEEKLAELYLLAGVEEDKMDRRLRKIRYLELKYLRRILGRDKAISIWLEYVHRFISKRRVGTYESLLNFLKEKGLKEKDAILVAGLLKKILYEKIRLSLKEAAALSRKLFGRGVPYLIHPTIIAIIAGFLFPKEEKTIENILLNRAELREEYRQALIRNSASNIHPDDLKNILYLRSGVRAPEFEKEKERMAFLLGLLLRASISPHISGRGIHGIALYKGKARKVWEFATAMLYLLFNAFPKIRKRRYIFEGKTRIGLSYVYPYRIIYEKLEEWGLWEMKNNGFNKIPEWIEQGDLRVKQGFCYGIIFSLLYSRTVVFKSTPEGNLIIRKLMKDAGLKKHLSITYSRRDSSLIIKPRIGKSEIVKDMISEYILRVLG